MHSSHQLPLDLLKSQQLLLLILTQDCAQALQDPKLRIRTASNTEWQDI